MEKIKIISKNMIQAQNIHGEPINRIELTPWDLKLLMLGPIQKGLLFLKPTPSQEKELFGDNVVEHLKVTFARALEFFYPLSGRLGVVVNEDNTSSFFIDCNNKGAGFIHAVVDDITIKDILEPLYVPRIVQSFFPNNGEINIQGDTNPLLSVQVNELVDGIFIGCTMNHSIVDGSSFWHFLNSWSEISRGLKTISRLPSFNRWIPSKTILPVCIPTSRCSYSAHESISVISPHLEERVFHFSKEKIKNLKTKANTEINSTKISSLQAVLAHLWNSVIGSQILDPDSEMKYRIIVGARPRLTSLLADNYFGNAFLGVTLKMKASELLKQGLGDIALKMRSAIVSLTTDVFAGSYRDWARSPELVRLSFFADNYLLNSSSPRFNMYGTDFGWGAPLGIRSGSANKCDGKVTFYQGVEEGSIDIEVCSSPEKLNALGNNV